MVGTMRRHLAESRLSHMEGAVIEEMGRVREELGWPIVMTPFCADSDDAGGNECD